MFVEAYGHMLNYNHEQAIACFMACTELDPNCAMAWWGIAYCVSSNYNWSPGLGSGYDPIQQALKVMDHCSELEQDLIRALQPVTPKKQEMQQTQPSSTWGTTQNSTLRLPKRWHRCTKSTVAISM